MCCPCRSCIPISSPLTMNRGEKWSRGRSLGGSDRENRPPRPLVSCFGSATFGFGTSFDRDWRVRMPDWGRRRTGRWSLALPSGSSFRSSFGVWCSCPRRLGGAAVTKEKNSSRRVRRRRGVWLPLRPMHRKLSRASMLAVSRPRARAAPRLAGEPWFGWRCGRRAALEILLGPLEVAAVRRDGAGVALVGRPEELRARPSPPSSRRRSGSCPRSRGRPRGRSVT